MKNRLLFFLFLALALFFGCEPTPEYKFKVRLESCSNRPDKTIEYISTCDPWIFTSSEGGVPRFQKNIGDDASVLNICDFEIIEKRRMFE